MSRDKKKYTSPKRTPTLLRSPSQQTLDHVAARLNSGEVVHLDLETTGLDPLSCRIVVLGLADSQGVLAVDLSDQDNLAYLFSKIDVERFRYSAFNTPFDASFITLAMSRHLRVPLGYQLLDCIAGDSSILFRMHANEGFPGQRWNLDAAQVRVLNWKVSNKDELGELLTKYNLTKNSMSELLFHSPVEFLTYCGYDAEASYQLERRITSFVNRSTNYVYERYVTLIKLEVMSRLRGIKIDTRELDQLISDTERRIAECEAEFRALPHVTKWVSMWDQEQEDKHYAPIITHKKVWARKADIVDGGTAGWDACELRKSAAVWERELGQSYYKVIKTVKPSRKKSTPKRWSITSKKDLGRLLYETELTDWKMIREPNPEAESKYDRPGMIEIKDMESGNWLDVMTTASGQLPVDKDVLFLFGEAGAKLLEYNKYVKLLTYLVRTRGGVQPDGTIHYSLRIHGTITGRSAGGGLVDGSKGNVQQRPNDHNYLSTYIARQGWSIVGLDLDSLENKIMAELSQDPLHWELYATGKPHCAYLYTACNTAPNREEIRKLYDMENPTKDDVSKAKKKFKKERDAAKVQVLSTAYGAAATSKRRSLATRGIWVTQAESQEMHDRYIESIIGVKEYDNKLMNEWSERGGYVLNGLGRPMRIPNEYIKDRRNRVIQSTAGDIMKMFLHNIHLRVKASGLEAYPWILDIHDFTSWEVRDEDTDKLSKIFSDALDHVNKELGGSIPMTGGVDIGKSFADFKD